MTTFTNTKSMCIHAYGTYAYICVPSYNNKNNHTTSK